MAPCLDRAVDPERHVAHGETHGHTAGGCHDELPENLARLRSHRAYLSQIITHRFGVDEIQSAFELFFQGETGKVLIEQ